MAGKEDQHSVRHNAILANLFEIQDFLKNVSQPTDERNACHSFSRAAMSLSKATEHYSAIVDELYITFNSQCLFRQFQKSPTTSLTANISFKKKSARARIMVPTEAGFEAIEFPLSNKISLPASEKIRKNMNSLAISGPPNEAAFIPIVEQDEVFGKYSLKVNQWSSVTIPLGIDTRERVYVERLYERDDILEDLDESDRSWNDPTQDSGCFLTPESKGNMSGESIDSEDDEFSFMISPIQYPPERSNITTTVQVIPECQDEIQLHKQSARSTAKTHLVDKSSPKDKGTVSRRKSPTKLQRVKEKPLRKRRNTIWDPFKELQKRRKKSVIAEELVSDAGYDTAMDVTNLTESASPIESAVIIENTTPLSSANESGFENGVEVEMTHEPEEDQDIANTPSKARKLKRKLHHRKFEVETYENEIITSFRSQSSKTHHVKDAFNFIGPITEVTEVSKYFYAILELANKGKIMIEKPLESSENDWFISLLSE